MKPLFLSIIIVAALSFYGTQDAFADGRPKMRELNEKQIESASLGVSPLQKKDMWGYANKDGKFVIRAQFLNVMQMSEKKVGFVSYINDNKKVVWTPIHLNGYYLTELEFDEVVKDFDESGLAIVKKDDLYGVISHTGKMLAECSFDTFVDRSPAYLLRTTTQSGWTAVVRDRSDHGGSTYSFGTGEPIIAMSEDGYGIISPKTLRIVADFSHDSIEEVVENSIYIVCQGDKKALYADDKLSKEYDDIIPENLYIVVKTGERYGVLSTSNTILLATQQKDIPVLKENAYTPFFEDDMLIYVKPDSRLSTSEYDDYLYEKYSSQLSGYLLEQSLDKSHKKYINLALSKVYGTKEFSELKRLKEAQEYARSRKFLLLARDSQPATYMDLETGDIHNLDDIAVKPLPGRDGEPAYIVARRGNMYGIIDIRNNKIVMPFRFENVEYLSDEYLSLKAEDLYYLYNIYDETISTPRGCTIIEPIDSTNVWTNSADQTKIFNLLTSKWVLTGEHNIDRIETIRIMDPDSSYYKNIIITDQDAWLSLPNGKLIFEQNPYEPILVAGRYTQILDEESEDGIYDVLNQEFVLNNTMIRDYFQYNGDDIMILSTDSSDKGVEGLYNITKRKLLVSGSFEDNQQRDGYVLLRSPEVETVYSFIDNKKLSFNFSIKHMTLLEDGFAIMSTPTKCGIYNLKKNAWHIPLNSPSTNYYNQAKDLGNNLALLPEYGVLNYITGEWICQYDWISGARVEGDFAALLDIYGEPRALLYIKDI